MVGQSCTGPIQTPTPRQLGIPSFPTAAGWLVSWSSAHAVRGGMGCELTGSQAWFSTQAERPRTQAGGQATARSRQRSAKGCPLARASGQPGCAVRMQQASTRQSRNVISYAGWVLCSAPSRSPGVFQKRGHSSAASMQASTPPRWIGRVVPSHRNVSLWPASASGHCCGIDLTGNWQL